jgi:hypothetical protein
MLAYPTRIQFRRFYGFRAQDRRGAPSGLTVIDLSLA